MISRDDYFMGRDKAYARDLTPEIEANAEKTIAAANLALTLFYADHPDAPHRHCNSGWRPPAVNAATPGAAPLSHHMRAEAVDLSETPDHLLAAWSLRNRERLAKCGILAMERPEACFHTDARGNRVWWVHWQTVSPGSGVFCFWPTQAAITAWQKSGDPLIVG